MLTTTHNNNNIQSKGAQRILNEVQYEKMWLNLLNDFLLSQQIISKEEYNDMILSVERS